MAKLTLYISVLSIALLLFHFTGLITDTPISALLTALTNPQNLRQNSIFITIIGILTAFLGIGAVIIGTIAPQRVESAVIIAFVSLLITSVFWDFIVFYNNILIYNGVVVATLFISPLFLLSMLIAIEWWRGLSDA